MKMWLGGPRVPGTLSRACPHQPGGLHLAHTLFHALASHVWLTGHTSLSRDIQITKTRLTRLLPSINLYNKCLELVQWNLEVFLSFSESSSSKKVDYIDGAVSNVVVQSDLSRTFPDNPAYRVQWQKESAARMVNKAVKSTRIGKRYSSTYTKCVEVQKSGRFLF